VAEQSREIARLMAEGEPPSHASNTRHGEPRFRNRNETGPDHAARALKTISNRWF